MRVLVVASVNKGYYAPFIPEQCEALRVLGVECELFGVTGSGARGYLGNLGRLREAVRRFRPDVIHAHYGLCGLLANLQRRVPVVTTYHGSDINEPSVLPYSRLAMRLSAWNVFVSERTMEIALGMSGASASAEGVAGTQASAAGTCLPEPERVVSVLPGGVAGGSRRVSGWRGRCNLLPCGVSLEELPVVGKSEARERMGLRSDGRYVLFAGAFGNPVKNAGIAREAVDRLNILVAHSGHPVELLELKGYTRGQVNLLMNAADALLMTSLSEGSPQVVKEAMAVGCPVVSVDVGDVAHLLEGLDNCKVTSRSPESLAVALAEVSGFSSGSMTPSGTDGCLDCTGSAGSGDILGSAGLSDSLGSAGSSDSLGSAGSGDSAGFDIESDTTETLPGRSRLVSLGLTNGSVARRLSDLYSSLAPARVR